LIKDDFPDPDTPVTAVNKPTGISISILFKLLANADFISINLPFGFALFYLRGVAPDSIKTIDIYRGVIPFIFIQILMLILLSIFPIIATWLPNKIL